MALCLAIRRPVPRIFFDRFFASLICLREVSFLSCERARDNKTSNPRREDRKRTGRIHTYVGLAGWPFCEAIMSQASCSQHQHASERKTWTNRGKRRRHTTTNKRNEGGRPSTSPGPIQAGWLHMLLPQLAVRACMRIVRKENQPIKTEATGGGGW